MPNFVTLPPLNYENPGFVTGLLMAVWSLRTKFSIPLIALVLEVWSLQTVNYFTGVSVLVNIYKHTN